MNEDVASDAAATLLHAAAAAPGDAHLISAHETLLHDDDVAGLHGAATPPPAAAGDSPAVSEELPRGGSPALPLAGDGSIPHSNADDAAGVPWTGGRSVCSLPIARRPLAGRAAEGPPLVAVASDHHDARVGCDDDDAVASAEHKPLLGSATAYHSAAAAAPPVHAMPPPVPAGKSFSWTVAAPTVSAAASAILTRQPRLPVTPPYAFRPAGTGALSVPKPSAARPSARATAAGAAASSTKSSASEDSYGYIHSAQLLQTVVTDSGLTLQLSVVADSEAALFGRDCDIRCSRLLVTRPLRPMPVWPPELDDALTAITSAGTADSTDVLLAADDGASLAPASDATDAASVVSSSQSTSTGAGIASHQPHGASAAAPDGFPGLLQSPLLRRQSSQTSARSSVSASLHKPPASASAAAASRSARPTTKEPSARITNQQRAAMKAAAARKQFLPGFEPCTAGTEELAVAQWAVRLAPDRLIEPVDSEVTAAGTDGEFVAPADESDAAATLAAAPTLPSADATAAAFAVGAGVSSAVAAPTLRTSSASRASVPMRSEPASVLTVTGTAAPIASEKPLQPKLRAAQKLPLPPKLPAATGTLATRAAGSRVRAGATGLASAAAGPRNAAASASASGGSGAAARSGRDVASGSTGSHGVDSASGSAVRLLVELHFRLSANTIPQGALLAFVLGQQALFRRARLASSAPAPSAGAAAGAGSSTAASTSSRAAGGAGVAGRAATSTSSPSAPAPSSLRQTSNSKAAVGTAVGADSSIGDDDSNEQCASVFAADGELSRAATAAVLPLAAASYGLRDTMRRGGAAPSWLATVSRDRFLAAAPGCPFIIV